MQIVSISGLDGSGKSTQIKLLKNYLESQGKKVFYFHAVHFSIANQRKKQSTSAGGSVTNANWLQIQLRKIALFIDLIRFKKLLKKLEKENFDFIISDRYFYDSLINIKYLSDTKYEIQDTEYVLKPDVGIYLQTDPNIIMQRDRKPDQGLKYLQKKKELYDAAAQVWNLKILDGNKNKEEIFEEIRQLILNYKF